MAHTLKINVNGSAVIDMGTAGTDYSVTKFIPRHPKQNEMGQYDLNTPIDDEIEILVTGTSADDLADSISLLDKTLHDATRYFKDRTSGYLTEMQWKPQSATNTVTTEVVGGWVEYPDDFLGAPLLGRVVEKVKIHVVHRPIWEGAALASGSDFSLSASATNNGASNFFTLPSLKGDLDARCKIKYVGASGNIASCERIIAAVRANGTPANFIHLLKVANAISGSSVTIDPNSSGLVATSAEANFLSANKARFNPGSGDVGDEVVLARWTISSNQTDQYGRFLVVVRYRNNGGTPNYLLRFRGGLSDASSSHTYGAFSTDVKVKTRYANSSSTVLGLLDLGMVTVPAMGKPTHTNKNLIYELLATPLSTSGTLDIDYVALYPVGEMDNNNGIIMADFEFSFSSRNVYVDSYLRNEPAYVCNTSDEKLYSPRTLPSGGEIRLRPGKSGQKVFFAVCSGDAEAQHDITNTSTVTVSYVPQHIRIKGTT